MAFRARGTGSLSNTAITEGMFEELPTVVAGVTSRVHRKRRLEMGKELADEKCMRPILYLASFLLSATLVIAADRSSTLGKVRTIFVAPLEGQNQPVSEMLREKLISSLVKLPEITVVDDDTDADAIFTCTGLMQEGPTEYGHRYVFLQGGVRLTSKEGGVVLWAEDVHSNRFSRSASSSFAENAGKSLGRALAVERQKMSERKEQ